MTHSHIVKSFDEDLEKLRQKIVDMAQLVREQFKDAETALINMDIELANTVRERDKIVNAQENDIEKTAIEMIAIRSPLAEDLREIISAIKISNALERIGDYAKNLSKRVSILKGVGDFSKNTALISQMLAIINTMNEDVIEAYLTKNSQKAISVWSRDLVVDNLYNSLFRELLTYMMENPEYITPVTHLLFVAKNVERAGDHITNIAEFVYYIVEGKSLEIERPKGDLRSETDIEFAE